MGIRKLILVSRLVTALLFFVTPSSAFGGFDPPPPREQKIIEEYTAHEWWLLAWASNTFACRVLTEQETKPGYFEIQSQCPAEVFTLWLEDSFCEAAVNNGDLSTCSGYYLYYVGSHQTKREVLVDLPSPSILISLQGCLYEGTEIHCALLPFLELKGNEPLREHRIVSVSYTYRGKTFSCTGAACSVSLFPTPSFGDRFLFWAKSSYGDSTQIYDALIRVKPAGDGSWQVDILSSQLDSSVEVFALEWKAFPPLGESPQWLSHSGEASSLATYEPYQYLAGQMIKSKIVDVTSCTDSGLLLSGYASQCGLHQAMTAVIKWQNRFDPIIYEVAERHGLSPQLIKNLIARESQFWPGLYLISPYEYGLSRLTEAGADTILMWNKPFFYEFCSQYLVDEACESGYNRLLPNHQDLLRGALSTRVNLSCSTCDYGFDFARVEYNIDVIAQSLLANAAQVGQMLTNLTRVSPGATTSYEDLWRFTLVNYNAGPGCLAGALIPAVNAHATLNWEAISSRLQGDCRAAVDYVAAITDP